MKNRILILLAIVGMFMPSLQAQSPDELIQAFFNNYQKGNLYEALDDLTSTNKFLSDNDELVKNWEMRFEKIAEGKGEFCGFELLEKTETGTSLQEFSYLVKYEKSPTPVSFIFYKPKDDWQFNTIKFGRAKNTSRQKI